MAKVSMLSVEILKRALKTIILIALFFSPGPRADANEVLVCSPIHQLCGAGVPVYSDSKIDIYTDQQSLKEAITIKNRNFYGNLFFVYKDEQERLDIIAKVREGLKERQRQTFKSRKESIFRDTTLSAESRKEKLDDLEKTYQSLSPEFGNGGSLASLKYMTMVIQYIQEGYINGLAGPQPPGSGPLMIIQKIIYNAAVPRASPLYKEGYDQVFADMCNRREEAYIGTEAGSWSLRLDSKKYPLFYTIIENLIQKIDDTKKMR